MSANEIKLFAAALVCWMEHRLEWETADVAGIEDGIERVSELTEIIPSATERSLIISLYHESVD
jgi:hypothetical protein